MILSGKIYQGADTLPMANVYVSDSGGKFTSGNKGVSGDIDGNYSIDVAPADFVTASFLGQNKTVRASDVCSKNSCNFDFKLDDAGFSLPEFEVVGFKDDKNNTNWKKIAFISGLYLVGLLAIVYGIKKIRN